MADVVTEVTTKGYGRRLGSSITSAALGFVLFIGSFVFLGWNEGNFVKVAQGLKEARTSLVELDDTKVNPGNDGKLVYMSGKTTTGEAPLLDPVFQVKSNALMLERKVEMFQWKEDEKTETRERVGGTEETTTTYTYTKDWSTKAIDSSEFNTPAGHENPGTLPYEQSKVFDEEARLGDFRLRESTIELIGGPTTVPVTEFDASKLPNSQISGTHIYIGAQPASPAVGDVRVSFSAISAGVVSVIAKQDGEKLVPYTAKSGSTIELVSRGDKTSDELITAAANKNTQLTWLYRAGGFLAMWIGLTMILGPFSMLFAFIPFLKSVTGFLLGVATLLVAVVLSSLTIAVMWLFYRPLVAIGIIVAAIGAAWLIKAFILDKKQDTPVTPSVPPVQNQTQPPTPPSAPTPPSGV